MSNVMNEFKVAEDASDELSCLYKPAVALTYQTDTNADSSYHHYYHHYYYSTVNTLDRIHYN